MDKLIDKLNKEFDDYEVKDIDITKEVPCYGIGVALRYLIGNMEGFGRGGICIGGIPH